MRKIFTLIIVLLSVAAVYASELADSATCVKKPRQSVGLVLSGGGAKGIAHAGVIQALEENGIPIDYIAGTSMGAIVGSLYASGYTPKEIIDLILSDSFSSWSTGKINPSLTYYCLKPEQSPAIVKMNIGKKESGLSTSILPSSFISPFPMNIGFVEVFTPHTAVCEGDFNKLFVPFRCVTSDVFNKKKVVMSKGDLGEAVRMSMTFPVAFKPIEKDGLPMFDGGIYDNFPVDVMKADFAPDIIIGIDVTTHETPDLNNLYSQLESMIIQQDDYNLDEKDGIKIHINLKEYNLLDFPKANEIFDRGYRTTMAVIDSIKSRVGEGVSFRNVNLRREVYKSKVPVVKFDSLEVVGTSKNAESYIRHIFFKGKGDTITFDNVKDAYYRTITSGKFRDLVPSPHYNPSSGLFDLRMKADVKDNLNIGIGGFVTSTTNSLAYLSVGYETIDLNSFSGDVSGWIGQSYYGGALNAKISLNSGLPTMIKLQGVASQQRFYEDDVLFFESNTPTFVTKAQYYGKLIFSLGLGRHSKFDLSGGFGYLQDRFYPTKNIDYSAISQDEANYKLGQLKISYDFNTLDNQIYPSTGTRIFVAATGVLGNMEQYSNINQPYLYDELKWAEAEFDLMRFCPLSSRFTLGYRLNAVASTKPLLQSYTASIVQAPAFTPTQYSRGIFLPSFQSNSFVVGGIVPIFNIIDNLQLRTEVYAFSPMREICPGANDTASYGHWFGSINFIGEASVVYNLSFASLSVYGNYVNSPKSRWNFGVSFGFFIPAPKFLR